jgi:WXG100 family type VII secretion target
MGFLQVTAEELNTTSSQLNTIAGQISAENAQALGLVNGLVGQGWQGAASGQFDVLFSNWKSSAQQLLESLEGISTLLSQAGAAYAETEATVTRSMAG